MLELGSTSSASITQQSGSASMTGKQTTTTTSIIPVFQDLGGSYEPHWIHEVVLSGVREECGVALKLERREDLAARFSTQGGVVVATGGLGPGEEQLFRELPLQQTRRMVLLHLSDESNNHDTSIYERFGAVYRNYYRANVDQSVAYLSPEEEPHEPSHARELKAGSSADVFWMPLGYGMRLLKNPSLMTPPSSRPLLFSWSGSTSGKEDRTKMLQALADAPDVLERGYLDKFDNFNSGGKDTPSSYTAMLYNSSIIPCPRGMLALLTAWRVWSSCIVCRPREKEALSDWHSCSCWVIWYADMHGFDGCCRNSPLCTSTCVEHGRAGCISEAASASLSQLHSSTVGM